jgi:hypothetical protein
MHYKVLLLLLAAFFPFLIHAQPAGWDALDQIIASRSALREAVKTGDVAAAARHTDDLRYLADSTHQSLAWDERWLAYHYTGRYALLLDEVARYDKEEERREASLQVPPGDRLFEALDAAVYERFDAIVETLVTDLEDQPEQQAFALLHLQYILRNHQPEEKLRREEFLAQYPKSKYATFVNTYMQLPPKRERRTWQTDVSIINNNWQGRLSQTITPAWGGYWGLGFWQSKFNLDGFVAYSTCKVGRNTRIDGELWPKDSIASVLQAGVRFGYDIYTRPKVRIWPAIEGGYINLSDAGADPDLFFDFAGAFWGGSVNVDLRLKTVAPRHERALTGYRGLRVRAGYHRLPFGPDASSLSGHLYFIGLGFFLHGG